jgi:hypothetical protein
VVFRFHICAALQQQTAEFKVTLSSTLVKWSAFTEAIKFKVNKNQLAETQCGFIQNNGDEKRREKLRAILRFYIRVALQQQTADFKIAFFSRPMQWSSLTEVNQKKKPFCANRVLLQTKQQ